MKNIIDKISYTIRIIFFLFVYFLLPDNDHDSYFDRFFDDNNKKQ